MPRLPAAVGAARRGRGWGERALEQWNQNRWADGRLPDVGRSV